MLKSNLDNKERVSYGKQASIRINEMIVYKSMKYFRFYSVYHFEAQNKRQKNQHAVCCQSSKHSIIFVDTERNFNRKKPDNL